MLVLDLSFGKKSTSNNNSKKFPKREFRENSIGSDNLKKAIERNRAKQLKRENFFQKDQKKFSNPPQPPRPSNSFNNPESKKSFRTRAESRNPIGSGTAHQRSHFRSPLKATSSRSSIFQESRPYVQ